MLGQQPSILPVFMAPTLILNTIQIEAN
jgi:hypothetical protein